LRDLAGRVDGRKVAQDHRELIATEPRHRVPILDARPQPLRHDGQQLIARAVPDRIVDLLEMIQIHIENGTALRAAGGGREFLRQAVAEQQSIGSEVRESKWAWR